jgi:hypothetical protein
MFLSKLELPLLLELAQELNHETSHLVDLGIKLGIVKKKQLLNFRFFR